MFELETKKRGGGANSEIIEIIKKSLIERYSNIVTKGPDTWKKVLDDTHYLNELFVLNSDLSISFRGEEDRKHYLDFMLENSNLSISDAQKTEILNTTKPKKTCEELFISEMKNLVERFKRVITPDNVNTYVEYSSEFETDKYPLWRKAEKFTPVLYLAKLSPICSESMLLILLKAGSNLSMRAATVGCLSYPTLTRPFFKKSHCTTIGKIARKIYFKKDKISIIPKLHVMYQCLKDINEGVFIEKRKYISENPELINGINFDFWKVDHTQSLIKRTWRCRYFDRITKPNSSLKGCGIPGISKYSESFQNKQLGRHGRVLLGIGAWGGCMGSAIALSAALAIPLVTFGVVIIPTVALFIIGVSKAHIEATQVDKSGKMSVIFTDMTNKTSKEVLEKQHDMLKVLLEKEMAAAPEENESTETKKGGRPRRNKTRRL